jgi:quercetin 2,3-dioxygenase
MSKESIVSVEPIGETPWKTFDPFLFCVHHDDKYPEGTVDMAPAATMHGTSTFLT